MNNTALRVVEAVLTELQSRKGFDGWWDDIDDTTRVEIEAALVAQAHQVLYPEKS